MEQKLSEKKELIVIFTKTGFTVDYEINSKKKLSEENQKKQEEWYDRFLEDKYKALWDIGFTSQDDWMSQSINFLKILANKLIMKISRQSDIEFTRENAELFLESEEIYQIKNRIPFSIGIEFIDDEWISSTFEKIVDGYRKAISSYKGTVKAFLTERDTNINVVGRVFFHLVENKDEDYPFAFLATYSTENKDSGL